MLVTTMLGVLLAPLAEGLSAPSVLGLGLFFGLRHALDADHIAAVWAIVSEHRSLGSSTRVGLMWGIGHTLALLLAGSLVIGVGLDIDPRVARMLDLGVAAVLIVLGANVLRRLLHGGRVHAHPHRHGKKIHFHPHLHDDANDPASGMHHTPSLATRPLLVGLLHGGAGSAALMLLVLSTIPSPWLGMAYVAVFGMGSVGGMLAMSLLVGLPARMCAMRFAAVDNGVRAAAGLFSIVVGLLMAYEIAAPGNL